MNFRVTRRRGFRVVGAGNYASRVMVILLFVVVMASACVRESDLTLEQQAYLLDSQLMCPVCDGQTLDQSQAQISRDMRQIIRERLADGETTQDIRDYFVVRYGEEVLAAPEATGLNTVAWVMPAVIGTLGLAAVGIAFRNMKVRQGESEPSFSDPDARLGKYLQIVEEDARVILAGQTDSKSLNDSSVVKENVKSDQPLP